MTFVPTPAEDREWDLWACAQPFAIIAAIREALRAGWVIEARRTAAGVEYKIGTMEFLVPNRVLATRAN